MATADQYAQWLIANRDKKGTSQFDAVSKAYELAKVEEGEAPVEEPIFPELETPVAPVEPVVAAPVVPDPDVPVLSPEGELILPAPPGRPVERELTHPEQVVGLYDVGKTLLSGATTGMAGQFVGTMKGIAEQVRAGEFGTYEAADAIEAEANRLAAEWTRMPETEAGRRMLGQVAEAAEAVAPVVEPLAPLAAEFQALTQSVRAASPLLREVSPAERRPEAERIEPVIDEVEAPEAPAPIAAPELVGEAELVGPAGERIAPGTRLPVGAMGVPQERIRAEKAAALPVPVELTRGAVTRDAAQLAFEKEWIKSPDLGQPLRDRAEENNLQALHNFDALIDMTAAQAPDVAATGNAVTKALSEGYKKAKNQTRVAYSKARNSEEAKAPVDMNRAVSVGDEVDPVDGTLFDYINSKPRGVESSKVTDSARATALKLGVAKEDDAGDLVPVDNVTLGQIEDFRRELSGMAGLGDKTGLRDETIMKLIIDAQTEGVGGDLYKKARALRTQQARKYENRAIVARLVNNVRGMDDPKVAADEVFRKSILNSSPDEIRFLRRVLATTGEDGKQAWSELQGATMRHIRDESTKGMGMDSQDNPIISPAKLHNVVTQLDKNGRLDLMFGKSRADTIRDLNEVVRYINTVPPGTLVNNSGTVAAALAAMGIVGDVGITVAAGVPAPIINTLKGIVG